MRVLIQNNVSAGQLFLSLISIVHWQQGANANKTEFDDYLPCLKKDQHVYFNGGSEVLTLTKPDEVTPTFVTRVYDNDAVTDPSQSGIAVEFPLQVHSPYYYNGSGAEPEPNNSSEATDYFIINDVLTCTAQHLSITEFAQHITDQEVIANDYIDYAQMHMHEWVTATTSTVDPTVSIYSLGNGDSATGTPSTWEASWTSIEDTCTQRRKLDIQIPKTWWQETPTSHASMKIVFPGTNFPENRVYQNFLVSCKLELGNTGADGSTTNVQYGKKDWVVVLKQMSDWTTTNQLTDDSLSVDAMPLIQRNEIVQAGVINPEDTSILEIGVALSQFEPGSGGFTAITAPVRADTINRISWDFTTSLQKSHFDKLKKFFISWEYYGLDGTLTTGNQKMYELDVATGWVPTSADPDSLNNPLFITDMNNRLCSCSLSVCDADARCDADTAFTTEKDVSTDNWYLDFWMGQTFKDNLQTQKKYWASLDADAQAASPLGASTYNQIGVSITVEARYSTIASDRTTDRRRASDTGGNRSFTMEFTIVDDSPVEVDGQGSNALDSSAACLASSLASMTGAIVCAAIVIA